MTEPSPPHSTRPSSPGLGGHIPVLDGVRGLAVLLVMWHHFFHPFYSQHPVDSLLIDLSRVGWAGVDLFFVLSGFLITGVLMDTRNRTRYFRSFFARRILRIFPMYYAVLALAFFVFPLVPNPRFGEYILESAPDQEWFWGYLTNWKLAARADWYPHVLPNVYWSLAVEEHFYLVWPFVVLLVPPSRLLRVCVLLIGAGLVVRIGMVLADVNPIATFVLTPARIGTIAAGGALAVVARQPGGLTRLVRPARWVLAGGLAFLTVVFVREGSVIAMSDVVRTAGFTVIALTFSSMLVLLLTAGESSRARRIFAAPVSRMFGKYSYSLYLLHGPIGAFTVSMVRPYDWPRPGGSMLPAMLVDAVVAGLGSLLAAWLAWHLVEKHFLRMKRFFKPGPVKPAKPAALAATAALLISVALGTPAEATPRVVSPEANGWASPDTPIRISFQEPVTGLPPHAVRVFGRWSGPHAGELSLNAEGTEAVFVPDVPFQAGELVTLTVAKGLVRTGGGVTTRGWCSNFWVRSEPGVLAPPLSPPIPIRRPGERQVQAYGAHAGDYNGDGFPDLAIPCEITADIRLFTGTPDDGMTLHAVESIPGGSRPSPIEGCDLDRDLRTDLVLGNSGNARVSVYRGTEAPEFIQSWQELTAANGVRAVAVLDADQDGDDDVLAAAREDNRLVLFLNDGTGTLASAGTFEGGNQESGLAVADANRDGILDVYVGTFGGRTVSLLLGDGDGGFRMSDTQAVPGNSWMLAPGDMNGDGYADVVSVNSAGNSVSVILTDGRGGLYPAESYHPGVFPLAVDVGDLDGDGDLDVVTSNWASSDWTVYSNFGDGSLSLLRRLDASSAGSCAVLHDRNGDGTLDITGIDEADDLIFLFRTEPLAPPPPGGSFPPPFPNPFSDVANVRFALEASGPVQIRIYDLRGRLVRGLHDGEMPAGGHRVRWDGTDARGMPVPAGVYLVRLSTRTRSESRRVVKLP